MKEVTEQRYHDMRELFKGFLYVIHDEVAWWTMPNNLPPWTPVYQQSRRRMEAGCFEAVIYALRAVLRLAAGKEGDPKTGASAAEYCFRPRKVGHGRAMMVRKEKRDRSCVWRLILGASSGLARHPGK
nr:transposase [uncultured Acetobacter sp.]